MWSLRSFVRLAWEGRREFTLRWGWNIGWGRGLLAKWELPEAREAEWEDLGEEGCRRLSEGARWRGRGCRPTQDGRLGLLQETWQRKADGCPWTWPCCDPVKVYWQVLGVWQHKKELRARLVSSIYLCSSESGHGEWEGQEEQRAGREFFNLQRVWRNTA